MFILILVLDILNLYISSKLHSQKPNVVVEVLKLLLRIYEFPGSNLGQDTGYAD
jgi:hypothetical protein